MSPRLSNKEKVKRVLELFSNNDRVLLPIVADPDSIASALALRRLLWRKVASATIASINEIKRQDNLTMLRLLKINLVPMSRIDPDDYSSFALVDGQPGHDPDLALFNYDLIIDHHPHLETTEARYVDIRPGYGANATIMTEYLKAANIVPSRALATALYYAIKTDTESFRRPTLEEDMKAFRDLYALADHGLIRKIEYSEIPLNLIRYYGLALDRLRIRKNKGYAHLGRVSTPDVLVMIADFLMRVNVIDTSIASGIFGNELVVIFRNAMARRNVGRLAQRAFGKLGSAGGHKAAARAEVPLAPLREIGLDPEDDEVMERFVIKTIQGRI